MTIFEILVLIGLILLIILFTFIFIKCRKIIKFISLNQKIRKLWSEHVIWTRDTIIANFNYNPEINIDNSIQRLYKNQTDFGKLFSEYYGNKIGNAVKNLLDEHITLIIKLITTIKNDIDNKDNKDNKDNSNKIEEIAENAINNANDIAINLNKINKKFGTKQYLSKNFIKHVELVFDQIKNPNDLNVFDNAYNHILKMADQMTNGFTEI